MLFLLNALKNILPKLEGLLDRVFLFEIYFLNEIVILGDKC